MLRAAPLVKGKAKFPVKNAMYCRRRLLAYGGFDCEFDFDFQEWGCSRIRIPEGGALRAAPLVRAKAKFTVKNAICCNGRLGHTALLTVNLAFTLTRGAALVRTSFDPNGQRWYHRHAGHGHAPRWAGAIL